MLDSFFSSSTHPLDFKLCMLATIPLSLNLTNWNRFSRSNKSHSKKSDLNTQDNAKLIINTMFNHSDYAYRSYLLTITANAPSPCNPTDQYEIRNLILQIIASQQPGSSFMYVEYFLYCSQYHFSINYLRKHLNIFLRKFVEIDTLIYSSHCFTSSIVMTIIFLSSSHLNFP